MKHCQNSTVLVYDPREKPTRHENNRNKIEVVSFLLNLKHKGALNRGKPVIRYLVVGLRWISEDGNNVAECENDGGNSGHPQPNV
jgi:hypothetical protein